MMNNIQQTPFLPRQKNFPNDNVQALGVEIDKAYIDIATRINERTIGIYPVNFMAVTGDNWFFKGAAQQSARQVYTFSSTGNIPHGINIPNVFQITKAYGSYTDGTNFYGAIFAGSSAIAGQVSFYISPTNIVVLAGAGAPSISSGIIVLEWVNNS